MALQTWTSTKYADSSSIKRPNAAISAANARNPRPTSRCRSLISAMILSVRQSTRSCLMRFSVFTSVSPQHEACNDAERKGGSERCDRPFRYDVFEMALLLAQRLAEIVQGSLD